MATRAITHTRKDNRGVIVALCRPGEPWSPRLAAHAIDDIIRRRHAYWVDWAGGQRTEIRVVRGPSGLYLRTDRDGTKHNNLSDLPDC